MKPSIDWVQLSLFAAISIAPSGAQAQAPTPILVLEVPVELRTLEPEVTRAFVECSLSRAVWVQPIDTPGPGVPKGYFETTVLGKSRTQIPLGSDATGGRATEAVQVVFELSDMVGEPIAPTDYACHVMLGARAGAEWPAVDVRQMPNSTAPGWTRMEWGFPEPFPGDVIKIHFTQNTPGTHWRILQAWQGTADAIHLAWKLAAEGGSTKGNNDQGDQE